MCTAVDSGHPFPPRADSTPTGPRLPPSFETDALNVIQDGLNRGANPRDIRRAARLLHAYEKDFWYTVGQN
jgi:hypothetical protein